MDKKILVICQSHHQLEKGLYIQKVIPSTVDVVFINQKLNLSSKVLLENVNSYKSFEPLSSKIDEYDKFIFFSMVPSQQLFALIQNIRRAKKIIIAIQETHQLSMHLGVVNNLIFSVDIIFAASSTFSQDSVTVLLAPLALKLSGIVGDTIMLAPYFSKLL